MALPLVTPEGSYTQDRGPYFVYPRIWRSDGRVRKEPLFPAHPYRASVSFSQSRKHPREITIDVIDPDTIEPEVDYIFAELVMTDSTKTQRHYPLGHYLVTGRTISTANAVRTGTIRGTDQTVVLYDNKTPFSITMGWDADAGASARYLLGLFGIRDEMIDIPDAGFLTSHIFNWDPGTPWLDIVNDVLDHGAMYPIWTNPNGIFTSRRRDDWRHVDPIAHYGAGGAFIMEPVRDEADYSMLRNRVTYYRDMPDDAEEDIIFTARVTDPSNPLHPEQLAQRRGVEYPVWKDEFVSDSTLPDGIVGKVVAAIKAINHLSTAASYQQSLTIQTLPDNALDGYQVVSVDLPHSGTHYYRGNWRQEGWSIEIDGPRAIVTRNLQRIEAWE